MRSYAQALKVANFLNLEAYNVQDTIAFVTIRLFSFSVATNVSLISVFFFLITVKFKHDSRMSLIVSFQYLEALDFQACTNF